MNFVYKQDPKHMVKHSEKTSPVTILQKAQSWQQREENKVVSRVFYLLNVFCKMLLKMFF